MPTGLVMPTGPVMNERFFPQVAIVPWRDGERGREILLVSTRGASAREGAEADPVRWVLPQGGVEPGQTPVEAAAAEAWEEAGVEGEVEPVSFAGFDYAIGAGVCRVAVYRLEVRKEAPSWPEKRERERRWLPHAQAVEAVSGEVLRGVLTRF